MSLARSPLAGLVMILMATACSEETTTSPRVAEDAAEDLQFTYPALTRESLIQGESVEVVPPDEPARMFSNGDPTDPADTDVADVFGARTNVGFGSGFAYSNGRHRYTGNIGRVETTVYVSFNGTQIGTRTQFHEESIPFLMDWGRTKQIVTEAYVFTDQTCGLTVDGASKHYAEWQWFLGGPAPKWGPASASTQAFPPQSQPDCQEEPEPVWAGGNEGAGTEGSAPVSCWYHVTYDVYTGEIYDMQLLYCDDVEGG